MRSVSVSVGAEGGLEWGARAWVQRWVGIGCARAWERGWVGLGCESMGARVRGWIELGSESVSVDISDACVCFCVVGTFW